LYTLMTLSYITGDRKAIDAAMIDIETEFETRRLGPMSEYIGCSLTSSEDGRNHLIQPDMVKKIEKEFGDDITKLRNVNSPMGPGVTVERLEGDPLLSSDDQKEK
jgi:hypothetical protein